MSTLMKPADLNTLRDSGVILAANVEFFHALGLNMDIVERDGKNTLIIQGTDDDEGVLYSGAIPERVNKLITDRQKSFKKLKQAKHNKRKKAVGFVQQQIAN